MCEILSPSAFVPASVAVPYCVEAMRDDCRMTFRVRLTDHGWWEFADKDLEEAPAELVTEHNGSGLPCGKLLQWLFDERCMWFVGRDVLVKVK